MTKTMKPTARMIAEAAALRVELISFGYSAAEATRLARQDAEEAYYARQDEADLAGLAAMTSTPVTN